MTTYHLTIRIILFIFIILGVFFIFNAILTATYYNPAVAVPVYRWAVNHHLLGIVENIEKGLGNFEKDPYQLITIDQLNESRFYKPRAAIVGKVVDEEKIDDGDWHLNIMDSQDHVLVAEIIPEYPLPLPVIGDTIKIWGITRYDLEHRWWEIHPVIGWQKL